MVRPVDGLRDRCRIVLVVRAHYTLDVLCGLNSMVEGHLGEQMMAHVCVCGDKRCAKQRFSCLSLLQKRGEKGETQQESHHKMRKNRNTQSMSYTITTPRTSDMVSSPVPEETITAIDCTNGTAEPIPLSPSKVWHVYIGVLQKGQQDEKHIYDEVRHQVVGKHRAEAC